MNLSKICTLININISPYSFQVTPSTLSDRMHGRTRMAAMAPSPLCTTSYGPAYLDPAVLPYSHPPPPHSFSFSFALFALPNAQSPFLPNSSFVRTQGILLRFLHSQSFIERNPIIGWKSAVDSFLRVPSHTETRYKNPSHLCLTHIVLLLILLSNLSHFSSTFSKRCAAACVLSVLRMAM